MCLLSYSTFHYSLHCMVLISTSLYKIWKQPLQDSTGPLFLWKLIRRRLVGQTTVLLQLDSRQQWGLSLPSFPISSKYPPTTIHLSLSLGGLTEILIPEWSPHLSQAIAGAFHFSIYLQTSTQDCTKTLII